jgi:hypothetical protein
MIDTPKLLQKQQLKSYKCKFSPSSKDWIINTYIGREMWEKIKNKKTRYILMAEALEKLRMDVILKYGSWYKWQIDWCHRNGFKDTYDYKKYLVKNLGFNTYSDYQEELVKKRGFKNRSDYEKKRVIKLGYKNITDYLNVQAIKSGFENYSQRRIYWKKIQKELSQSELNSEGKFFSSQP